MKGRSVLLALSGSQQSKFAAELCWSMANKLGAEVTAQHVIDSHSAWEFLGHEKPGFLDSEKYLTEYQSLSASLFGLGEDLAAAYAAESTAHAQSPLCIVDEGNPVSKICERALSNDLVVIGHRPTGLSSGQNPRSQFWRLSMAEALAHDCPRPLLVVQEPVTSWQTLAVMTSTEHINELFINSCLDMATALQLQPALLCLSGCQDLKPVEFMRALRDANPRLETVPIAITDEASEEIVDESLLWSVSLPETVPEIAGSTLIVIPTREIGGHRVTVLGSSPSSFIRFLNLPSILLWPEEYIFSFAAATKKNTAAVH